jgi:hypothetical protein
MERNEQSAFQRPESAAKHIIWGGFQLFESPCRMLIEVFIRKDFGERYFRLSSAIGTFAFFASVPLILAINWYAKFQPCENSASEGSPTLADTV